MSTDAEAPKKKRKARRGPGTDKPDRVSFTQRVEKETYDKMQAMLKGFDGSRNDYIEGLIKLDVAHRERFKPLNMDTTAATVAAPADGSSKGSVGKIRE